MDKASHRAAKARLLCSAGLSRSFSSAWSSRRETVPSSLPILLRRSARISVRSSRRNACAATARRSGRPIWILRTAAGVLKGGESGAVVVPGKPEKSLLYEKVHNGEMPPGEEGPAARRRGRDDPPLDRRGRQARAGDAARGRGDAARRHPDHAAPLHGLPRPAPAREAGLDLRTKAAMLRGGKSGPAIVPGKPDESLLIKKIAPGQMPPPTRLVEASVKPIEPAETRHARALDRGRRARGRRSSPTSPRRRPIRW